MYQYYLFKFIHVMHMYPFLHTVIKKCNRREEPSLSHTSHQLIHSVICPSVTALGLYYPKIQIIDIIYNSKTLLHWTSQGFPR